MARTTGCLSRKSDNNIEECFAKSLAYARVKNLISHDGALNCWMKKTETCTELLNELHVLSQVRRELGYQKFNVLGGNAPDTGYIHEQGGGHFVGRYSP